MQATFMLSKRLTVTLRPPLQMPSPIPESPMVEQNLDDVLARVKDIST